MARGELAAARLEQEQAISLFQELELEFDEIWALNGLGNTLALLGETEEARKCYLRTVEVARRIGASMSEGRGLNNIGTLEYVDGDPGAAERYFRKAYEMHLSKDERRDAMVPASNVAYCKILLGQYQDAVTILEEALQISRQDGYEDSEIMLMIGLADVYQAMGNHNRAAVLYRSALSRGDRLGLKKEVDGLLGLAKSLAEMDSSKAALAVLETQIEKVRNHVPPYQFLLVQVAIARFLQQMGDHERALDMLGSVEARATEERIPEHRMAAPLHAASSYRALGYRDSALACLRRSADVWEEARDVPTDREWREQRGEGARLLYTQLADLTLDAPSSGNTQEQAREAFVELQQFKARAILESVRGPGRLLTKGTEHRGTPEFDITLFQKHTLGENDLFLDAYLGSEKSFLFAVTRETCLVSELPGLESLSPKLHAYRDLLATPPESDRMEPAQMAWLAASRSLGGMLLEEITQEIRNARRILVAADGPLHLIPIGTLILTDSSGNRSEPLLARSEVIQVPSAAFLLQLHRRDVATSGVPENSRRLAVAITDAEGSDLLTGALREARLLGRRYQGFEVWDDGQSVAARFEPDALSGYGLIHIAAHTTIDDQHPWRSGVLLTREGDTGKARYMRASQISSVDLGAELVVLSGCESAGGRIRSGEGVVGLTNAFLTAGVPVVVATLWPVDDDVTVQLVEDFYRGLEEGKTVGIALQEAQLTVRSRAETSHPFYWAGFIAIGNGDAAVELHRQSSRDLALVAVAVLLGLIALAATVRLRSARRPG
jgi:tetratricopeptide (TPR) repeat protein